MKALIIMVMLALLTLHVWLSHKRFHGPNKVFLKEDPVQLSDGISMRTEFLDRILEGDAASSSDISETIEVLRGMKPPGRIVNRLNQRGSILARWSNGKLTLSGQLRDADIKQKLIAAASMPVDGDRLEINKKTTAGKWVSDFPTFLSNFIAATDQGEILIEANSAHLEGRVQNGKQKQALLTAAKAWGIPITDKISLSQQSPSLLAKLNNGTISLTGKMPSADVKKQLADLALSSGNQVDNQITVSEQIANPKWLDKSNYFLTEYFKGIDQGEVEVGSDFLRLNRQVDSQKTKETILQKAKGFELKTVNQLSVRKESKPIAPVRILISLTNQRVTLSGEIPDDSLLKSVANSIRLTLPNAKIIDRLKIDKKIKKPEWHDQLAPMLRDFLASNPKSAEIEITDQTIRFKREVINQQAKQKLVSVARGMIPNGKFVDQITVTTTKEQRPLPAKAPTKDANLLASLSNNRLTIKGFVHSQELKDMITQGAEKSVPGVQVSNQIVVDSKAIKQPGWASSIKELFCEFWSSRPDSGEFEVSANQLRLRQELKDEAKRDLVLVKARQIASSSNQRLVNQLTVAKPKPKVRPAPRKSEPARKLPSSLTRKPATVLVTLNKRQLTLSGYVPSDEMRDSIAEVAIAAQPKAKLINNIQVDKQVRLPTWDLKILDLLSDFLSSPADSELEVNPEKLRLKQALPSQEVKDKWIAKTKRFMPGNNRFIDQLSVSANAPMPRFLDSNYKAPSSRKLKEEVPKTTREFKTFEIYFLTNSTWVKPVHEQQISNAAQAIKQMRSKPLIEVKGFADQRGSYELNKSLSEGRAQEVVETFVKYGLDRNSIQILAVGEAEANGYSERDRRVEVRILETR